MVSYPTILAQIEVDHLKEWVFSLSLSLSASSAALAKKVRELHARVAQLEGEKYDWEVKLRRQDIEINELTMKVNDVKGKLYVHLPNVI